MIKSCAYGQLFKCESCNKIHLEFNNIGIDFINVELLIEFNNYIKGINTKEFEFRNRNTNYRRKILIPFPNTSIKMLLTIGEVEELIKLNNSFLNSFKRIDLTKIFSLKTLTEISQKIHPN